MSSAVPSVDRIGPYRVVRPLETTGVPTFVAREEGPIGFRREVVLKIIASPRPEDGELVKELAREATICSKLNHPNIIRTHDFFEDRRRLVLVLEHVEGVSLAELLSMFRQTGEKLSDAAVFFIGIAVLEALAHAHGHLDEGGEAAPVVHSAVSPATVFLGKDGTVKLSGFALAKIVNEEPNAADALRDASYMAPEQKISEKVDVYAAGLLLWELLTGRSPAEGIEPLSVLRRDLPREVLAAIDAAIEQSTHKRTISCSDMASWIKKAVHYGRGRKELRQRISALTSSYDSAPLRPAARALSCEDSLFGWVLRASQAAEKWVESRSLSAWLDALTPNQRRAGIAAAMGALLLVVSLPVARSSSRAAKRAA